MLACAPSGLARDYSIRAAPYRANPRFAVTYHGSGTWHTTYHSEPPNPGGMHDTNDAHDTSTQHWRLSFAQPAPLRRGVLAAATVTERATGSIDHTHIDGLFAADNASEHCSVSYATPARTAANVTLSLSVRNGVLTVAVADPMATALTLLPQTCPGDADPIDGLFSNYFMPGFSFAQGWGPDRWFASTIVRVPLRAARRARRITVREHATPSGTPPVSCAVAHPSYERCTTGGAWSGVLVLRRRPHPPPADHARGALSASS